MVCPDCKGTRHKDKYSGYCSRNISNFTIPEGERTPNNPKLKQPGQQAAEGQDQGPELRLLRCTTVDAARQPSRHALTWSRLWCSLRGRAAPFDGDSRHDLNVINEQMPCACTMPTTMIKTSDSRSRASRRTDRCCMLATPRRGRAARARRCQQSRP